MTYEQFQELLSAQKEADQHHDQRLEDVLAILQDAGERIQLQQDAAGISQIAQEVLRSGEVFRDAD